MRIAFMHPKSGNLLLIPVSQVVVYNDDGQPIALTYEHGGLLIHSDVTHEDFGRTAQELGVRPVERADGR